MQAAIQAILSRLRNQVTRAKHALAYYSATGGRTLVQVTGLSGEVLQDIELLLPYGYSARPVGTTADLLIFQVNANRDHKVGLLADDPACRIAGLQPGEFGLQDNQGQQIVFKRGGIIVNSPLEVTIESGTKIRMQAPILELQATSTWRLDIAGYALQFQWSGSGDAYTQTTWYTGAVITDVTNNVSPPGVFNGP